MDTASLQFQLLNLNAILLSCFTYYIYIFHAFLLLMPLLLYSNHNVHVKCFSLTLCMHGLILALKKFLAYNVHVKCVSMDLIFNFQIEYFSACLFLILMLYSI